MIEKMKLNKDQSSTMQKQMQPQSPIAKPSQNQQPAANTMPTSIQKEALARRQSQKQQAMPQLQKMSSGQTVTTQSSASGAVPEDIWRTMPRQGLKRNAMKTFEKAIRGDKDALEFVKGNFIGSGAVKRNFKKYKEMRRKFLQEQEIEREADEFKEKAPELIRERQQTLYPTYERTLEEGTRKIREGASRRGLLYSGMRQSQESGFKADLAANLARAKAGIAGETQAQAEQMIQAAAAQSLENAQQMLTTAEQAYNISLQNDLMRRQRMTGLLSGIGSAVGTYYGMRDDKPNNRSELTNEG